MKITGTVVKGDGRGRTLGYPTANISVPEGLSAENGVYAAVVELGGERYGAMANLGVKPTFSGGAGARVLELYLFGFGGDIYGCDLVADLVEFIRPEQRFATPEALRAQIEKDKVEIEKILKSNY